MLMIRLLLFFQLQVSPSCVAHTPIPAQNSKIFSFLLLLLLLMMMIRSVSGRIAPLENITNGFLTDNFFVRIKVKQTFSVHCILGDNWRILLNQKYNLCSLWENACRRFCRKFQLMIEIIITCPHQLS